VATTERQARALRARRRSRPVYRTLIAAIEELRAHPRASGTAVGVVGFSMGAHWALWLAQRPDLPVGAAVAYYGARGGDYTGSRASFLAHFAEIDPFTSVRARRTLESKLRSARRPATSCVYPGRRHWFAEADRPEHDAEAARLAWRRTTRFLRAAL
jgi:carboxymethylenebutenolidase